ncbi:hypothetical protein T8K17_08715 [Thalassobaculum sp. OXR-137]|uniref:hypothetical protein n=1 Tax=Thalassobaculum sp. OXR-137 TaxID=3100173 RepID=UPI002AC9C138|nr:hypothetical protein [Thalassobaculum sp. OXR-137]WPZ36217.1 hypothetical protein T8K17_08715 [Thalassobaculum sp. OXR-137]
MNADHRSGRITGRQAVDRPPTGTERYPAGPAAERGIEDSPGFALIPGKSLDGGGGSGCGQVTEDGLRGVIPCNCRSGPVECDDRLAQPPDNTGQMIGWTGHVSAQKISTLTKVIY